MIKLCNPKNIIVVALLLTIVNGASAIDKAKQTPPIIQAIVKSKNHPNFSTVMPACF